MVIGESADLLAVPIGDPVNFAPTVSNVSSDVPLADVEVEDKLPVGLVFISASNGGVYSAADQTVRWSIPFLDAGSSVTLDYMASLDSPGDWTDAVCVAASDASGDDADDCTDVEVTGEVAPSAIAVPGTTAPPPAAPQPMVTAAEDAVLADVISHVEEDKAQQGAPSPQVPVQIPSPR